VHERAIGHSSGKRSLLTAIVLTCLRPIMNMPKDIVQTILVVDDDASFRRMLKYILKQQYHLLLAESAEHALTILAEQRPDLIVLDVILPGMSGLDLLRQIKISWPDIPVLMLSATNQTPTVVEAIKLGASDYLTKPIIGEELCIKIDQIFAAAHLSRELAQHRELQQETNRQHQLIGYSAALEKIRQQIQIVGKTDVTVLIQGETGTGKEVVAHAIHACSPRAGKPFVALNCGAIPKELLEAELFGHAKGAFTGAHTSHAGKFQLADKGVLLLDEVGELSLDAQTKLLRVLEGQEFYPVGGNQAVTADVRVIASTHRDLEKMVAQETFREDLFFRLQVYTIVIPPLRDHPEDILPLTEYFLAHFNRVFHKTFQHISLESQAILERYPWRGNVRDLRNLIERVVLTEDGPVLECKHLACLQIPSQKQLTEGGDIMHLPESGINLDEMERQLLIQSLKRTQGNKTRAAKLLHLSRATFLYRLEKHGLM